MDLASAVCPDEYKADEALWRRTVDTILHEPSAIRIDKGGYVSGEAYLFSVDISLAVAIDMLWPCNWIFEKNVLTVLEAIGGQLTLSKPYAACARNICRSPIRSRMADLCHWLIAYGKGAYDKESPMHQCLGRPTPEKKWLSLSLAKTIRLQLYI